ncbi:hypothetical protein GA0070624_6352 [Micromonospora rhizosphaerae]|uniref:Uncharacterized protein n=1 Tax=Micromonospora rhizosphaerae TaxID=568872 RepID=A0A1C6TAJ6_9ACTN|nr:hypothetical protein [Micromonospora rhizosphaerae]SCL38826.1 hypothetical protein GA0070624_6352 [Micromonospora rhizosphaerae]
MWGIAERRGATALVLSATQTALLQTIYNEFRASNAWPTMYRVDRAFIKLKRRGGANTAAVMRDLPEGLLMRSQIRPAPIPDDEIKLTISGVAHCLGAQDDVESFVRAVRWCARQEMTREPEAGETSILVSGRQVKRAIPLALRSDPGAMDRLPILLTLHHWGCVQSGRTPDGTDWTLRLGPEVRRFSKVRSIEDFIDARVSWYEEEEQRQRPYPAVIDVPAEEVLPARAYINPRVLDQLREASGASWDTTKLVALAEELDACVQAGHVYASHAVLRALLDHVPPLFGQKSFAAVVSSHAWAKTDAKYLGRLSTFRDQADDALHRQISKMADLLMLDNLPQAAAVNALLRGCAVQLQKH